MKELERIIANNSLNLRIEIEQYIIKARIEELDNFGCPSGSDDIVADNFYDQKCERIAELKKGLDNGQNS